MIQYLMNTLIVLRLTKNLHQLIKLNNKFVTVNNKSLILTLISKIFKNSVFKFAFMYITISLSSCSSATIEEVVITDPVTFDADVNIIITDNCLPCHAGTYPAGGVNLEGYVNVRSATENGNLIESINSLSNPMPQNGLMPPALIATIEQWAIDGYLEN